MPGYEDKELTIVRLKEENTEINWTTYVIEIPQWFPVNIKEEPSTFI